jgi:hypothetical protein
MLILLRFFDFMVFKTLKVKLGLCFNLGSLLILCVCVFFFFYLLYMDL